MKHLNKMNIPNKQQGAALVVCLIILLVMSVIGVSSVSNSTIQQRMAFNLRQQQLAENAAEHALRAAENYLTTTITSKPAIDAFYNDSNSGTSFFMCKKIRGESYIDALPGWDLTDSSLWASGGNGISVAGLSSESTSRAPRYIIEFVGKAKIDGAREITKASDSNFQNFRYNFRITAIGWGVDPNAYAVLQSTFETVRILDM